MSKLKVIRHSMHNTVSNLRQYGWRGTQLQLRITRTKLNNGRYRRVYTLERGRKEYHSEPGLLHSVYNLRYRIVGDKPSIQKHLQSWKPKTWKGKVAKGAAVTANFIVRDVGQTAVDVSLATEAASLKIGKAALDTAKYKLVEKYRESAVDDTSRATVFVMKSSYDAVRGLHKHYKQKAQSVIETQKYQLLSAENNLFKTNTYQTKKAEIKKDLLESKQKLKAKKKEFKLYKKGVDKKSQPYKMRKQMYHARKQKFRQTKKELKFNSGKLKSELKFNSQNFKNQRHIKNLSRPGHLVLKPAQYYGGELTASAWQKTVNSDENNDFMTLADNVKRHGVDRAKEFVSKGNRLQSHLNRRDVLSEKNHVTSSKLHKKEYRLQASKDAQAAKKAAKRKARAKYNNPTNGSTKKNVNQTIKKQVKDAVKAVEATLSKEKYIILLILVLIVFILFPLIILLVSLESLLSGSTFILGTYVAQDFVLSKAEIYYIRLAWNYNENLLDINSNHWKKSLKGFDIDTSGMKDTPDEFIWGQSAVLDYSPVYDFDRNKLWSFLCAYYYEFPEDDKKISNIKYWNFTSETQELLDEMFEEEYKFECKYDNTSHWEYRSEFISRGYYSINGSGVSGGYGYIRPVLKP